jgi:hypothetical protein
MRMQQIFYCMSCYVFQFRMLRVLRSEHVPDSCAMIGVINEPNLIKLTEGCADELTSVRY